MATALLFIGHCLPCAKLTRYYRLTTFLLWSRAVTPGAFLCYVSSASTLPRRGYLLAYAALLSFEFEIIDRDKQLRRTQATLSPYKGFS